MGNPVISNCIGVDGCKDGWVVVSCPDSSFGEAKAQHYGKLSQLSEHFLKTSIVIIDIPIGLSATEPNRKCDVEARKFLGARSSTIFSPPCLAAIFSENYNDAKVVNLSNTGKSISKQSWFLSKKILEAKQFSETQFNLKEGHPECSFADFLGEPLIDKKKSMRGLFKRAQILEKLGFKIPILADMLPEKAAIGADDLLDAAILCWTANKFYNGKNKKFPSSEMPAKINSHDLFIYF